MKEKGDSSEKTEVMEIMDVNTKRSVVAPQNSDFREHSRNLLESAAGEAQEQVSEQRSVKQALDPELHSNASENREHSQNSREKQAGDKTEHVKVTMSVRENQCSAGDSDFSKHSQNSLSKGEPKVDPGEVNVSFGDRDGQCLAMASKFQELSPNLRVETECSEGTQKKQHTKPVCIGKPSEYSRDLLGGVGNNVLVPSFSWFKSMSQIVGLTATWQDKVEGNPMGAGTASNAKINTNPVYTEFNFFL